jgi:K+-transporting ATPase ATPase C chain
MFAQLRAALLSLFAFTLLTGVLYPLVVTGLAQLLFPRQANGSLVEAAGRVAGSELIGQNFSAPRYFWGRISATTPFPYNSAASTGSNYGPFHPDLRKALDARLATLRAADPENHQPVPVDLLTSSASGLDPHLSPAGARYQAPRVARARGLKIEVVLDLVERHTRPRQWSLLGEPVVNVLDLNLALDRETPDAR